MKKCQICQSGKIRILHDTLYCANCEIYFSLDDGKQRVKSLPIVETKQRAMKLCLNCNKKYAKNNSIKCKVFLEYFKKLPFCKQCKALNSLFLKNLFFKNFLLYKKTQKTYGIFTLFFFIALAFFSSKKLIFYYVYLALSSGDLGLLKAISLGFTWYHINRYSFSYPIVFTMCFRKILFVKEVYFDVPINLMSVEQIQDHLDRLKIGTSTEKESYKLGGIKRKYPSCLDLGNNKMI